MWLLAQPRISIPNAAWNKRVVIAGDDKYGARTGRAFEDRESTSGIGTRHAVIVENVARDENKIYPELSSLFSELLERDKTSFANPVRCVFLKPSDSQTQVQVCCVEEANHKATLPIDIELAPL